MASAWGKAWGVALAVGAVRGGGGGGYFPSYPATKVARHKKVKSEEPAKTVLQSLLEVIAPPAPPIAPASPPPISRKRQTLKLPAKVTPAEIAQVVEQIKLDAKQLLPAQPTPIAQATQQTQTDGARIAVLESQVAQLSAQIILLAEQVAMQAHEIEIVRDDGEALFLINQMMRGD